MNQPSSPESAEIPKSIIVAGILQRERKIPLIYNLKTPGHIRVEPFGGKKEPGETPEEAIVREGQEEFCVTVKILSRIGSYPTSSIEGEFEVITFRCELTEGEPRIPEEEWGKHDREVHWHTPEELRTLSGMLKDERRMLVVPNLLAALDDIEACLDTPSA